MARGLSRRGFLAAVPAALGAPAAGADAIDRRRLVSRHNPRLRGCDGRTPLSVGNGEFAFTVDATGLQTFPALYEADTPLCTQSQWGWHSFPSPGGKGARDLRLEQFETYGRQVGYATSASGQEELYTWLRENPHRLHLGRIGFLIERPGEVGGIRQELDLWTGTIKSQFEWRGQPVAVETCCDPEHDSVAAAVTGKVPVVFEFPYGSPEIGAADWNHAERHRTTPRHFPNGVELRRELDGSIYFVTILWRSAALEARGAHRFVLHPSGEGFSFVCHFSRQAVGAGTLPDFDRTAARGRAHWAGFWSTGGAIDLSNASDPRAEELERRIVLSQYLTAIQCAGSTPPQETGLTCNSWYGKFHVEMHFWHAAHFTAWGRAPLLERSLAWYGRILPAARERARQQGYLGARWPKMTAPDGADSPSPIGPLLVWQQPHPIVMAELCYRAHPDRETLERYCDLVFATADFLASYAHYEAARDRYVLGPPLIPAQENHPARETWNPTLELEYFAGALGCAARWRERLNLAPIAKWDDVRRKLSRLPVKDGVYLAHENCPQTFTERNRDHPSMLGALGWLPGRKVDRETMRRTLYKVMAEWEWATTWGWDFGMVAMTAASLGERERAIGVLLMESPKNTWRANGHNWQRPKLPVYLPGNGALLLAAAHMVRTGAFPDGWRPRAEGLLPRPLY